MSEHNWADLEAWEAYCEASLNLSNQDDASEDTPWIDCADGFKDLPDEDADLDAQIDEKLAPTKASGMPWS